MPDALHALQQHESIERKLDAVVGVVRILHDPELRLQYDDIRKRRLSWKHNNTTTIPPSSIWYKF